MTMGSNNLRAARKEHAWNQQELARRLDVSQTQSPMETEQAPAAGEACGATAEIWGKTRPNPPTDAQVPCFGRPRAGAGQTRLSRI